MKKGFTCSCFDLMHPGHIKMLQDARNQCDYLIVGLQEDPTIDRPDTKNKPIHKDWGGYGIIAPDFREHN